MRKKAVIKNGRCSNCNHVVVRNYKEEPGLLIYMMSILREKNKMLGICNNCHAEFELPHNFFTIKYIIKKISRGGNEADTKSDKKE